MSGAIRSALITRRRLAWRGVVLLVRDLWAWIRGDLCTACAHRKDDHGVTGCYGVYGINCQHECKVNFE